MSSMILVAFFTLAELLIIALGVIVLLGVRLRAASEKMQRLSKQDNKRTEPFDAVGHFEHALKNTEAHLGDADDQHSGLLRARMCYLQAELNAIAQKDYEAYWQSIYHGLAPLIPEVDAPEPPEEKQSELAELDDPDPVLGTDGDIPTLEAEVTPSHEPSNEVKRLRKLIARQHQAIESLKQLIHERGLPEQDRLVLEQSIQDVEVAHAQLNLGLDTIERENGRLHGMLEAAPELIQENDAAAELAAEFDEEDTPPIEGIQADTADEIDDKDVQVSSVNEEVSELDDTDAQISSLNAEIAELDERLQQRTEDLLRLESLDMDLSHDEETQVAEDPEQVRDEIEALSELLLARREELAQLAPESVVDIDADAANDSDGAEAESFPEVDWEDALTESAAEQWAEPATAQTDVAHSQATDGIAPAIPEMEDGTAEFPEINWDDAIAEIDTAAATTAEEDALNSSDTEEDILGNEIDWDEPIAETNTATASAVENGSAEDEIDIDALLAATEEEDEAPVIPDIDDLSFGEETESDAGGDPSNKEASA